jgi:hypothetical protein
MVGVSPAAAASVSLDAVQIVQSSSAYWVTNTSVTKSITNNKTITFSAWVNVDNFTNRKAILNLRTSSRAPFLFVVNTTGTVRFLSNGGESDQTVVDMTTSSGVIASAGVWYHIAGSFDLADTSKRAIYINGSPVTVTYSTYNNANINLNVAFNVGIGNNAETTGSGESGFKFSQLWVDNSYIDLSTNISKFYNAGPVDLGATGTETGLSQPLIYHYGNTSTATTIRTNRGRSSGVYASYTLGNVGTPTNATGPST